jgi:hypothetical protein
MRKRSLRRGLYWIASISVGSMLGAMTVGVGSASAIPVPTSGASGHWFIGKVETDRGTGSDTTFFMMQQISDLYNQAALYGCTLQSDQATCNTTGDVSTTDTVDNYDRTEQVQGIDDVGSGAGQAQLCGTTPSPLPVDYSRSSKPPGTACTDFVGLGYAKDGVPAIDFPTVNPDATYGTVLSSSPYFAADNGVVGPVAAGWLPGDPIGGPYSGTPFTNVTNNDSGGGQNSVAYRIWCSTATSGPTAEITDWGQLTNLSAANNGGTAQTVGNGKAIGIPINVVGVNPASGTDATFSAFAQSGFTSGNCASNTNTNAGPPTGTPNNPGGAHSEIALENNASQIGTFARSFYSDAADQAAFIASSLYYESNGVYNSNVHAGVVQINSSGGQPGASGGTTTTYPGSKIEENGIGSSAVTNLNNSYPTARTLYNIYRTGADPVNEASAVRASTANFLNWICDSNHAFTKASDNSTGINYDTELTTLISTKFGFPRLTDTSAAPNNSCQLITSVAQPNS